MQNSVSLTVEVTNWHITTGWRHEMIVNARQWYSVLCGSTNHYICFSSVFICPCIWKNKNRSNDYYDQWRLEPIRLISRCISCFFLRYDLFLLARVMINTEIPMRLSVSVSNSRLGVLIYIVSNVPMILNADYTTSDLLPLIPGQKF